MAQYDNTNTFALLTTKEKTLNAQIGVGQQILMVLNLDYLDGNEKVLVANLFLGKYKQKK